MNHTPTPCFACNRPMVGKSPIIVRCADEQTVFVGSTCYKNIHFMGREGWQPPKGGPRLYLLNTPGLPMYPCIEAALKLANGE